MTNKEYLQRIIELLEERVNVEYKDGRNVFEVIYEIIVRL